MKICNRRDAGEVSANLCKELDLFEVYLTRI